MKSPATREDEGAAERIELLFLPPSVPNKLHIEEVQGGEPVFPVARLYIEPASQPSTG